MSHILIIDDAPDAEATYRALFPDNPHWLTFVPNPAQAVERFSSRRPDLAIVNVPPESEAGLEVFDKLRAIDATVPLIVTASARSSLAAIEATKRGAFDYMVKPFAEPEFRAVVNRALEVRRLMIEPVDFGEPDELNETEVLVGHSLAMQEVYKSIGRVAQTDVTVLIEGETGTGKELVARAIYHHSKRATRPFMAINCAAIPETLLESEMFGYEKGAFTGADRRRIGKFEQCSGGTLFLDEIAEMSPPLQAKMLRVLQDGQVQRIGGNETIPVDVRVIAATNRDLRAAAAESRFRSDLYYRLNVFNISLPALRRRREDVGLLVHYMLGRLSRELLQPVRYIAPRMMQLLTHYSWPGNVRELQSVLKQAMIAAGGPVLTIEHLPAHLRDAAEVPTGDAADCETWVDRQWADARPDLYRKALARMERELIVATMRRAAGNLSLAARALGITRSSLRFKMRSLGLLPGHSAEPSRLPEGPVRLSPPEPERLPYWIRG